MELSAFWAEIESPSKTDMAKLFRVLPGAQNFSAKFWAEIQKSHEEIDECFLCRGLFRERNEVPRQIGGSDWSQVMRFMKKFDIPPCILGLGAKISSAIGQQFRDLIRQKMATFGLVMPLSQGTYKFCDVEMALLQLFVEIDYNLEIENIVTPDLTRRMAGIVKYYQLPGWPAEICHRALLQSFVLMTFFDFELQIFSFSWKFTDLLIMFFLGLCMQVVDALGQIPSKISHLKGSPKKGPKEIRPRKVTNQKLRSARNKLLLCNACKSKKTAVQDTTSVEGNKFHKRFRKTKRNVRV